MTKLYDKISYFALNFPFKCSNIISTHAYGVNISQLMQYLTVCIKYHSLTKGLLAPVFLVAKLTSSLRKIMKAIMTWLTITGIYV
jgi:hypothetical protein